MPEQEATNYSEEIELLSEKHDLSIEQLASHYRQLVYGQMMATRGSKYKYFLWALRASKYVSCRPMRGTFLENYYAFMRYFDDIVDGDAPLPDGYGSTAEYLERKIAFANKLPAPTDSSEMLIAHCFDLGHRFGEDFRAETADILGSLHFDAKRRNLEHPAILSQEELQHHFYLLDIRGTINACLKLADEKQVTSSDLEPLGNASRIHYTLRDFEEDIAAGFVNISKEDMESFGISPSDLRNGTSAPTRNWLVREAQKGLGLLKEHRKHLPTLRMRGLIKAALWTVYEKPARNCFTNIIEEHAA